MQSLGILHHGSIDSLVIIQSIFINQVISFLIKKNYEDALT